MNTAPYREIDALLSAVRHLAGAKSMDSITATATAAARALVNADGVTFVLREGESCYYAREDAISPLWQGLRFPMDACISGWCMRRGEQALVRDVYQDPRIPQDAYRPTFVRSMAMVPVQRDAPIAAMGAYWSESNVPCEEHLAVLQTVADATSLGISNVELQHSVSAAEALQQEAAHRLQNAFALALSLVRQTDGETTEDYREAVMGRLSALDRIHRDHQAATEDAVRLDTFLKHLVAPYSTRWSCHGGEDAVLPGAHATALALIVNELATNAMKYGAWSSRAGWVHLVLERRPGQLRILWRESDGPKVPPPTRRGLGSKLIKGLTEHQLGGQAHFRFEEDGLVCELTVPMPDDSSDFITAEETQTPRPPR